MWASLDPVVLTKLEAEYQQDHLYRPWPQYDSQMLSFANEVISKLNRYIGVLNVTFEKQQKRKASAKENGATSEGDAVSAGLPEHIGGNTTKDAADRAKPLNGDDRRSDPPRLVSQSISSTQAPTPTVTFADNRHIIPKSFLQPSLQTQEAIRRYLSEGTAISPLSGRRQSQSQPPPPNGEFTFRPTLSDKHAASWGATTVNKKLRNEVFGEAFLQQPIPIQRHIRPAHQHRPLAHRAGQPSTLSQLRTSNSDSNLIATQQSQSTPTENNDVNEGSVRKRAMKGAAERNGLTSLSPDDLPTAGSPLKPTQVGEPPASDGSDIQFEEKAATSAPVFESPVEPYITKRKRRYSSGGLRRKPEEDAEDRGNLKYFEEADDAGYKGDGEPGVLQMDSNVPASGNFSSSRGAEPHITVPNPATEASHPSKAPPGSGATGLTHPPARSEPMNGVLPMPRPVNPKEAQTQRDKRVEFFLLLEDLTAGMRRPCIMDLKMGTRQYGVDANEKKQNSQRRKCAETTSKELGVRVCGLQVWDVATQSYIFQDKYFGRKLKAGREFRDALQRFLFDGVDYASVLRHIPTILHKLSELEILIKDLRGYRFYAASLLMFYDGEVDNEGVTTDTSTTAKQLKVRKREIDFKIADFANCITAENEPLVVKERACPPRHPNEPDKGFLRGLKSLKTYFIDIQKEVVEIERKRGVDVEDGKNNITNGHGLTDDPLDEDLGEVSY
jgi:inositol-hexakisphosphate kinase